MAIGERILVELQDIVEIVFWWGRGSTCEWESLDLIR